MWRTAAVAMAQPRPVRYAYKANPQEEHVGFIAEDVPELVARADRRSLAPMDIVAVLTRVVQPQGEELAGKARAIESLQEQLSRLALEARLLQER
jgi:hypothetical protein